MSSGYFDKFKDISGSVWRSSCGYLLQHYLGKYFQEKLDAKQLAVKIFQGKCTFTDVRLNTELLNELAEKQNWPVHFVEGYIQKLDITIPWKIFFSEFCTVKVSNLRVRMQTKRRNEPATSVFESMWSSMTSSLHLAEDCIKQDVQQTFDGVQTVATAIETILNKIEVTFVNSVFQLEHLPPGSPMGVGLIFNIGLITYTGEPPDPSKEEVPKNSEKKGYSEQSYKTHRARLEEVSISTVEFSNIARTPSESVMTDSSSTNDKVDSVATLIDRANANEPEELNSSSDERNVIMFGKFEGKVEVIVRMKRTEDIIGPKVSIEIDTGPLVLFLSPRQFRLLFELASGFASSEIEDYSNVTPVQYAGKPMTSSDYSKLEKDIQQQISENVPNFQIHGGHGWSTGNLDEGSIDDIFMPLGKHSGGLYDESALSEVSTMESSFTSSMSTCTDVTSRKGKRLNKIDTDPTAEISKFEVHVSFLSVLLLHEDLLTESYGTTTTLVASSVKQMQTTVANFFSSSIVQSSDFRIVNRALDAACKLNHIRLLACPLHLEADETTTTTALSINGHLDATDLELTECLYQTKNGNIEHVPLLTFANAKQDNTAKSSSLHLVFKHLEKTTKSKMSPKTDLHFQLNDATIELDVTLIDRISALLNPQPIVHTPKPPSTNPWTQSPLHQDTSGSDSQISVRCSAPSAYLKLRFPIPDFRPSHDMSRTPWWQRHVRPDFLLVQLTEVAFETWCGGGREVEEYVLKSRDIGVWYYEEANGDPLPVGKSERRENGGADCSVNVKIHPPRSLTRNEPPQDLHQPTATSILMSPLVDLKPSGPFSSKKVVHESDTPHNKAQTELLIPGVKSEMDAFITSTTRSSRVQVDVTLPTVSMQLISKRLYEIIYNRIFNDLLLWEPSAPKHKTNTPVYDNLNFTTVVLEGQDEFRLCKNDIHNGSESDSEEDHDQSRSIFYSTYGSKITYGESTSFDELKQESFLSLNVRIKRGLLCFCTPVRDATTNNVIPNQQGEFLVKVTDANLFMVSGYIGDPNLSYTCLELCNAQLYHCDMISTPSHSPPLKDIGVAPGKHLHPTICGSDPGTIISGKERGGNREMVTLCIKVQGNHETHQVKNVSMAVGFNKVTLRHQTCPEPNSWLSQLMDFFNVTDYPIPGYQPKEILTELFLHFWDSAIDYRPKYLPLRAAITIGTFSISSHLSAEINTSTLRFIAEYCALFLSEKVKNIGPVDLRRDYVNVIDFNLFEISLKTSDKKNPSAPHFDLRASNNVIHIRTCADSTRALTQLIKYLASNADLVPPEETASESNVSSPSHLPHGELVSMDRQEITNVSESQHQQISDLIKDAVADVDHHKKKKITPDLYTYSGTKMYYFPDENVPSSPIKPLPQVTTELGTASFFAEHVPASSDDEFCFIDQEPGYNIFPKSGSPEIRWRSEDPVRIVENHFFVPTEKFDPLKTSKSFPVPTRKYTLCDMSIVWSLYGGCDFNGGSGSKKVNFTDVAIKGDVVTFKKDKVVINSKKAKRTRHWMTAGGVGRDHNVMMEFQLSKVRFQHEVYPESSKKASRQVLCITEIEIRDRLKKSSHNKFLCLRVTDSRPKQTNGNMLVIKTIHVRPDPLLRLQECCLKVSILPLCFHIDQDALQFLKIFYTNVGTEDDELQVVSSKTSTPVHQPPIMTVTEDNKAQITAEVQKIVDQNLLLLLEENKNEEEEIEETTQVPLSEGDDVPIYFRKVIFSPDVPIMLDYSGKYFDLKTDGALQGIVMGLAQLTCSELRLKRIMHRHGLLGVDKLLTFLIREWFDDIKKNQIPNIVIAIGPMVCLMQLLQGIRDLICMPFEQYRKDGRFLTGLQRGANSFTTSTAMAALELTTRLIHLIQITAETAFDMLTPGPSVRINRKTKARRKRYALPKDIREGVTNAYILVKEGIEETAENIFQVVSQEHEMKGYSGAVGGVMRQIPPTIIKPVILASEATNKILGGVKSQLVPNARKEATDKWKDEDSLDMYEENHFQ